MAPHPPRSGRFDGGRRPLVAALFSTLIPGLGQLYAGRNRRGVFLLAVSLVGGGVAVTAFVNNPRSVLKLAFDPAVLLSLLLIDVVLLVFRGFAVVDAYRILQPGPGIPRWALWSAASGIAFVLVLPHAMFAYYDLVQYDFIETVFASGEGTITTTNTSVSTRSEPVATTASTSSTAAPPPTSTSITPTTTLPTVWDGLKRLNILLLGSDAGVGRTGVRTDTMILASIDPDTGDMALISIPRNFARVPLPSDVDIWQCDCFPLILNELYQYGEDNPASFPGQAAPGANAIKGAIGELVGLPVHFYALVAMEGFVDVVDAVGGVTITVTERVHDPAYPKVDGGTEVVDIQPGVYEFDGHDTLAYVRTRYLSDDYSRMGRQRCVIEALVDQAGPFSLLRSYPRLVEIIKANVVTDIPLDVVPDLIDLVATVDTADAVSLRLVPPTYITGRTSDGYNIPDVALIREHAEIATTLPPSQAMELLGIDPLVDECS